MYVLVASNHEQFRSIHKRADLEGFEVLGTPIGTETHHAKILSKKVEKTELLLDRLQ